jgi:ATP-dependent RNA helicase DDX51/DBP6
VGKYTTPPGLRELYLECDAQLKPLVVHRLLTSPKYAWRRVLCFVSERASSRTLCGVLEKLGDVRVGEFSSLLTHVSRRTMLRKFAQGEIDVLVATDAVARGIDVPDINYVVCYDCPRFVKTYIHRVGRTARAGKEGTALTLLAEHEVNTSNTVRLSFCQTLIVRTQKWRFSC